MSSEYAITGFTGQEDGTLLPDLDQHGDILYPDTKYEVNMLCNMCQVVTSKAKLIFDRYGSGAEHSRETVIFPFYATRAEIAISAGTGCHLCSIFLLTEKTRRSSRNSPDPIPNGLTSWVTLKEHYHHIKLCQLRSDALNKASVDVSLFPKLPGFLPDRTELLSASSASEATFRLASASLVSCLKEHGHESTGLQPLESPKRLLYLGDQLDHRLRVIYPTTPTSYLTVSHCWGGKVNRTLNAETYSELTTGFEDTWLPRLWRDCVIVTRRLGYAYLWIDSLCIQQDDSNNKAQEIMNMGDIYRGSVCNIAAVSAADSSASLFTRYVRLGSMDLDLDGAKKASIYEPCMSVMGVNLSSPTPLYERAWVVQERILAPRTLEYTWQGVRYCCPSITMEKRSRHDYSFDRSAEWAELLKCDKGQMSNLDKPKIQNLWIQIVWQYARAALTMETDRKIALNGIIGVLSKITGLSFCSGVCKDLTPYSLLWYMGRPRDLTCHPSYAGPSWSCTFRHAEVERRYFGGEPETSTGIDCSFDELRSIVSFNARCSSKRMIKSNLGPYQRTPRENIELQNLDDVWLDYSKLELFDQTYHDVVTVRILPDYNCLDPVKVDFALLLYTTMKAFGLVLTKTSDASSLWKRLGMFNITMDKKDFVDNAEALKNIQDPLAFMLAPWQKTAEFQIC